MKKNKDSRELKSSLFYKTHDHESKEHQHCIVCPPGHNGHCTFLNSNKIPASSNAGTAADVKLKIAYVDLDSIQANYLYYREKMTEFDKKKKMRTANSIPLFKELKRSVYLSQKGDKQSPNQSMKIFNVHTKPKCKIWKSRNETWKMPFLLMV